MNPLESLKQKLMVKPNVKERERVVVVIKGEEAIPKKSKPGPKSKAVTTKIDISEEEKEGETKEAKEAKEAEAETKEEEGDADATEKKALPERDVRTLIVDETEKGFDRTAFLQKMKEQQLLKVKVKPLLEEKNKVVESVSVLPEPSKVKKAKKIPVKKPLLLIEEEEEEAKRKEPIEGPSKIEVVEEELEVVPIQAPKKATRKTKKVEKGVAVLGPEIRVEIGEADIMERLHKRTPPINIKVSSYYMNNREIFVNFINGLFEPYRKEIETNKDMISCDDIGQFSSDFSLLTHQQIVRDYMNLYTPYRGLLLYHGLGSGKTCTSIAIAEGMKNAKKVIIMTPASLKPNYVEELKKCGDLLYKRNQYWEWISTDEHPEATKTISAVLNLPIEYITRHHGAWFINASKPSNYDELSDIDKKTLEDQLNEMINSKYLFIKYNGLRARRLAEMTSNYTRNIFDNSVVVIDEAHNLISRIVNKIEKEKTRSDEIQRSKKNKEGKDEAKDEAKDEGKDEAKDEAKDEGKEESVFGENTPLSISLKIYQLLLSAKNARIILLSGTPVINYPNEFAILFNILRGYIKTWKIPLNIKSNKKIDRDALQEMLLGEKSLDYLDYSPSSKILTITRNPFGFKNKIKKESGYQGVSNVSKDDKGNTTFDSEFSSDDDFERKIINILRKNDIDVEPSGIKIFNKKALPDKLNDFMLRYVNSQTGKIINEDALKRRIIGLSSYFRSAQENLLPKYNKQLGVDYHVVRIPMSDYQFKIYEDARVTERKMEKPQKSPKNNESKLYENSSSTYRIFSRLFCNFVMPDRPFPNEFKIVNTNKGEEPEDDGRNIDEEDSEVKKDSKQSKLDTFLKKAKQLEQKTDMQDEEEGEVEGDNIIAELGGEAYRAQLETSLKRLEENANDYLTPEALHTYSPKFLHILENIKDPDYAGLHLVYSQFRTAEGIGIFTLVLKKNGFAQFKIKKNSSGIWEIYMQEADKGKPTFALYTGTETAEEKEMVRHIYNGEWEQIPENISSQLRKIANNNNMGEIIKVFMITSSGSEGINLRNTRYVHIMDPYWHPVRLEQVIGRARRICSHKSLPKALQTVEVFVYIMIFTEAQLKSDIAIELKRKDLSKAIPRVPITSDQYLYEISEIKANVNAQLMDAVKQSSFDCNIYSNGKCINFGDANISKFSYVPDFSEQSNDTTVQSNKVAVEWVGKSITINGTEYVYRRINKSTLNIYDKSSYLQGNPVQIGTYEINEQGEKVFKLIG